MEVKRNRKKSSVILEKIRRRAVKEENIKEVDRGLLCRFYRLR